MTLSDLTVRTFMRCLFNKDYEGVDNWEELYTQYIDLSGLGENGQLGLYVAIHNLNVRLFIITHWLEIQHKVFALVKMPHIPSIDFVKTYGHRIKWPSDNFVYQLTMIESKEKRNYVELKNLQKQLDEMKKAEDSKSVNARNSFVIMLNMLGKEGYRIDRDKTDMEELALMIKQHGEDVAAIKNNIE